MLFTLKDGPKSNTYIAPSGATYRVLKDVPFEVTDERDIVYFGKKKTFDSEEFEPKESKGNKPAKTKTKKGGKKVTEETKKEETEESKEGD